MVFFPSSTCRWILCSLCLCALLSGCGLRKPKDATPVVGPPPPRVSLSNDATTGAMSDQAFALNDGTGGGIAQAEYAGGAASRELNDFQAVAYVNGDPILMADVLEPYAEPLRQMREKLPPERFRQIRLEKIREELDMHIDNKLLVQAFLSTLDKKQQDALEGAVDEMFNKEIEDLKLRFAVNTDYELEMELQKHHTSLRSLRQSFANRVMATEFLRSKSPQPPKMSRVELVQYYNAHKDEDYAIPAKVRWQQLMISYAAHGGKEGAKQVLLKAADELKRGIDFAEVAKKYSDGPGADRGGYWDWMERGSLSDEAVEAALFTQPIGQISDVFQGPTGYQLVRVLERRPAGYVPFEDLQSEIEEKMLVEQRKDAAAQVMEELRSRATIRTIFDERADNMANGGRDFIEPTSRGGSASDNPFQPLVQPLR